MSIFRRENDPPPEPVVPARPSRPAPQPPAKKKSAPSGSTHIATGSKVIGQISGSADLVIDGVVEGEIHLESRVVVGSEGRVEGKILARSVEVGGKVLGNVQGVERVEVLASGSLEGDVLSPRVVIAEGAFFKGKVEMTDKIAKPAAAKPAAAKPAAGKPAGGKPGVDAGRVKPVSRPEANRPGPGGSPSKLGGAPR